MIDYMIMEAVSLRVRKEEADAAKAAEREQWKKDMRKHLEQELHT